MTARNSRVWSTMLLTVVLISCAGVSIEAQCSMCRTLLATPEGERMAAALRSGIWILLAAPFAIFGVVGYAAVKSRRRLAARCNASAQPPGADALSSATEFAPPDTARRCPGS
jgi:hypothetical protein